MVLTLASVALIAVAAVLAVWDAFTSGLAVPAGLGANSVVVTVKDGEGLEALLPRLATQGLVKDVALMRRYLRNFHDEKPLVAGEYELSPSMSAADLVAHLESGRRLEWPVDIPEGSTVEEAADLLSEAGIVDRAAFVSVASAPALLRKVGLPHLEGYLLPEVYSFARGTSADVVAHTMVQAFERVYAQTVGDRTNGLTRTEVVTLASLIEKSSVAPKERRLFSALLRNRLRAGIPLQSASARAYAKAKPERSRSAWDTFAKPGLPPGPICSPGTGALLAAADPATSRALYAVARDDGTHVFCDDLDCLYEQSRRHGRPLPRPLPLPRRAPSSP
ncbi:MAG: endolytic transglycosylase MltG [Myxococcota bacterium]